MSSSPASSPSCVGVILCGGPAFGTRFRPLSLDVPKCLFPVAGKPMIEHHIAALSKIPSVVEIILLGQFEESSFETFVYQAENTYRPYIRYVRESGILGNAGSLIQQKSTILSKKPEHIFILHSDIACSFPLEEMLSFHMSHDRSFTMCTTQVEAEEALKYGCVIVDNEREIVHYSEKPEIFVSNVINTGIYVVRPSFFDALENLNNLPSRPSELELASMLDIPSHKAFRLEFDIFTNLAENRDIMNFPLSGFWSQVKSPSLAVLTARYYMEQAGIRGELVRESASGPFIVGDVIIHPSAEVHPSAKLGPNVTIGAGAIVGKNVRVENSIILEGVDLKDNCCVLHSIIGWSSTIGRWARVEGSPVYDMASFNHPKKMCILGSSVVVSSEVYVSNTIVLPNKSISEDVKDTILL